MGGSRISCLPKKIIFKLFLITLASNAIGTMSLNILKPEDFAFSDDDPYIGYISGGAVYYNGGRLLEIPMEIKRNPASMGWLMGSALKMCQANPTRCADGGTITEEPKFFARSHRKSIGSQRSPFEFLREI